MKQQVVTSWDKFWAQAYSFWERVAEVWNTGVMGASISDYVTALLILMVFLLFRQVFSVIVMRTIKRIVKRTHTSFDDQIVSTIEGPVKFLPVVLGWYFALRALPLIAALKGIGENITTSMLYFVFFWAIFNAVPPVVRFASQSKKIFTDTITDWIIWTLKTFVVLLGAAAVLETWDIPVAPVIGGLGLFGVAVALGAQDLFKNLIAGVLILAEKRFRKGDWILVDGVVEGNVEVIGFRSTSVRRFDKALVLVPNAALSDNAVTNFTAMTFRRIYWHIGVTYGTSIKQLELIRHRIEEHILNSPEFARPEEAATFVRIDRFGASSIDLMVYCFTRTTVWGEWLQVKERLAKRIKEIVEDEAGSSFAFPSQSLYVEALPDEEAVAEAQSRGERNWDQMKVEAEPGEKPERFTPPGGAKPVTVDWKETADADKNLPAKAEPRDKASRPMTSRALDRLYGMFKPKK